MTEARLIPGRGFKPFNSVLYYGMRLLPYAWLRRMIAYVVAYCVNWLHAVDDNRYAILDSDDTILTALQRAGSVCLKPLLSQTEVSEIMSFLSDKLVAANGRFFHPTEVPPNVTLASYSLADVISCPHVFSLINDVALLRIARAYLGCCPTISSVYLQWSFPSAGQAADVQCFHRDPDDWRFLKLFIYLTDVDEESGPHEFVLGSHRSSGRIFSKPYSEEEVVCSYGRDRILGITGRKGTTFIEDTWGIHRARMPAAQCRLLLQVQYSILPIMKFKYRPVSVSASEYYDRYVTRLLVQ